MAELPDVWSARSPERRPLYDRPPTFGLARDAERMREGVAPPPIRRARSRSGGRGQAPVDRGHPLDHRIWQCRARARQGLVYGRAWTHFRHRWSSAERGPVEIWHRVLCRRGRHDFRGGHAVQLGSNMVLVERRCVWCEALPF